MKNNRSKPALGKQSKAFAAFLFAFVVSMVWVFSVQAATKYWIGPADGNFTSNTNWSTTTGGAPNTTAPGASDIATFDANGNTNCTMDNTINVAGINIISGYTGVISPSSPITITIGASGFTQADGTFTGGDGTMTLSGTFNQSGGIYNAPAGMTASGDFTKSDGTFNAGTGTMTYTGQNKTINVGITFTFYNLIFNITGGWWSTITAGQTLVVSGDLTLTAGVVNSGTIDVRGNIIQGVNAGGGNVIVDFGNDLAMQTYTINGGMGPILRFDNPADANDMVVFNADGSLYGINITAGFGANTVPMNYNGHNLTLSQAGYTQAQGIFNAPSIFTVNDKFTKSGGTFNANGGKVIFRLMGISFTYNVIPDQTFYNVEINVGYNWSMTITSGQTIVVADTLTLTSGTVNAGTIKAMGDINQATGCTGGSATLDFGNNSVVQTYTINGGMGPILRFDNPADANDIVVFNADGSLFGINITADFGANTVPMNYNEHNLTLSQAGYTQAQGTFNAPSILTVNDKFTKSGGTFNASGGKVIFRLMGISFTYNVIPDQTFYDVEVNVGSGWYMYITSGQTMVVNGTLTLTSGLVNTGTIDAMGDINQAATFNGGTTTLDFGNNLVSQTYTLNGGTGPNLHLDDPADALDFIVLTANAGLWGLTITEAFGNTNVVPFTYNSHVLSIGAYDNMAAIFIQASGIFNAPTSLILYAYNKIFTKTGGTFNAGSGTVTIYGDAGTYHSTTTETFNNVNINMENGYPLTITSGETMIVAGTLAFMSGGINSGTIEARGNATVASAYSGGSTFLAFTGSNTQSFNLTGATGNYDGKITVNKTGGQVNLLSALVMDAANQDLTIQQGTFNLNGNDLNVNGTSARLIVNNTGNLQLKGSETITVNSSYPQLDAGSTVTYYGTSGPYTIKNYTYSNLIINGSGATFSLSNTLDVNGSFTLLNGTFSPVSYNMTVGGNWLNSGGTYTAGTSSVTFDGTAAGNTITTAASPFYNLTINGSGGAWTLQDALTISNILTISSGTVTQGNNAITSSAITQNGGTFTGNSSVSPVNITITGDVSLSGGSFTSTQGMFDIGGNFSQVFSAFNHNSGTIDLNGTGTQTCLAVGTLNNVIHSGAGTLQLIPLIRSYPDWLYRDKIILSPTIVSNTDQTDFPLLIKFATHNGLRDHAQANFNDVFFTSSDRTTKLSHEIEKYDKSTGELWAWVKIPVLSSSANTILYMYYGNPGASNQRDGIHVWDANFKAVYHLGENGSPYNDVTSNANNSMGGTNPSQIDAVVGKGENFNGSSQDISFPQIFSTSSETTVSIWVKFNTLPSVSGHYNAIIGKSHNGSDFDLLTSPLDNKFYWYGGATVSSTTTVADINTWYYVVATFKSNNYVKVYINGNYENQGATGSGQIGNTNALDIGQSGVWPGRWLGGIADEARVSTVARSADWIKTEYNNQHNPTAYQSIGYDTPYTGLNLAGNLTNSAGTLDASNQNIILAGNWINSAIFIPGTDTVILNGINQNIFGTTGFSNLKKSVSSAGILGLEKGKTTTINSLATLNGTVGNLLSIRTVDAGGTVLNDGSQATIDFKGTTSTGYLDVRDNIAASSNSAVTLPIEPPNSTDAGNTVNWFCTRVTVSGSSGANGIYTSLTNASGAFAAINTTPQTGNTILITFACSSTAETGTISLTAGTWTSLTMYPVTLGLTISGNPSEPYITLDGADYVTIDGRLNGSGVTKTLTISKIQFINSAVNDIIKYCSIAGDFSVSGTSSATLDGETTVGGNLKIEGGSNLSTTPASDLTISGTLTIRP